MLSDHEQQAWKDAVRFLDAEAEEPVRAGRGPTRRRTRESRGQDEMAVGSACVAIMLVFVGAPVVGLAVGGATALGWLLWRVWPQVTTTATVCALPVGGDVKEPAGARGGSADAPGSRRLHQWRQPTKALPRRRPGGWPGSARGAGRAGSDEEPPGAHR